MIKFALRGDSLTPRYNTDSAGFGKIAGPVTVDALADPDVIGGSVINCSNGSLVGTRAGLVYTGKKNFTETGDFSILIRCEYNTFSGNFPLFSLGHGGRDDINQIVMFVTAGTNQVKLSMQNSLAQAISNAQAFTHAASNNIQYDYVITYNNTTKALKVYRDNTLEIDVTTGFYFSDFDHNRFANLAIAYNDDLTAGEIKINEFVIWDEIIDPNAVTLTSGSGALNGSSRAAFVDVDAIDGSNSTDPGIGNVTTGTTYYIDGILYTGTREVVTVQTSEIVGTVSGNTLEGFVDG